MKKALLFLALTVCLSCVLGGCGALTPAGVVDSGPERLSRWSQIQDIEGRMFVDDLDYFLLRERATYLSEYAPYVGH